MRLRLRILLFSSVTFRMQKNVFMLIPFWRYIHLHHFSKIKSQQKSQNSRNEGFLTILPVLRIHDILVGSGSGSADPCLWLMDPDPAVFVIDLQDANKKLIFYKSFSAYYILKVHLHNFSKIKSQKEVRRIRIQIRIRITDLIVKKFHIIPYHLKLSSNRTCLALPRDESIPPGRGVEDTSRHHRGRP